MYGFTAAEAIGQPFTLHIPPERHAQLLEITSRLLAQPGQVVRSEGANLTKNGALIEVSTVCFAIRDGEGKVVAISAIQRDITERKRAERENAALADRQCFARRDYERVPRGQDHHLEPGGGKSVWLYG